jgi:hypothetical protein
MNMESPVAAVEVGTANVQPPRRGWFRRNWLWFVPTLLLAMILLCGGCLSVFGYIGYNQYIAALCKTDVYKKSFAKTTADAAVQGEVGQPIELVKWPPPVFADTESGTEILCDLKGPKGVAKMQVRLRKNDGRVEIKVILPSSKQLLLDVSDGKNVAPTFQKPKTANAVEPKGPPPEVDLDVPDAGK